MATRDCGRAPGGGGDDTDNDDNDDDSLRVLPPMPEPDSAERTPLLRRNGDDDGHDRGGDTRSEFEGLPWWRVPSVYWLAGPFFLFVLARGGTIVPKLNLILQLVCRRYYADQSVAHTSRNPAFALGDATDPECLDPAVQRRVTSLILAINLVIGFLSAAVTPRLGHLADRYGRTRIMALASCGGVLAEIVTIAIVKFADTIDYRWFILSAVFEGATGSYLTGSMLSHSYVSDCTPPSKRNTAIGYLHACIFTAVAVGPVVTGWIVHVIGSLLSVFYITLACNIFYGLFVALFVPESLSSKDQLESREKHARLREEARMAAGTSLLASLRAWQPLAPLAALTPRGPGASPMLSRNLVSLAAVDTILLTTAISAGPVIILYSEYSFHWGNLEASVLMSSVASLRVVILLCIFPIVNHVWRIRPARCRAGELAAAGIAPHEKNRGADHLDIWLIRFAILSDCIGALGYALSPSATLFFASGLLTSAAGLGTATIQAAVTKHMPSQSIGQLLGAFGLLQALGRVFGPMMLNGVYYATVASFPQTVFAVMCGSFVLALAVSFSIRPGVYLPDSGDEPCSPNEHGEVGRDDAEAGALLGEDIIP